MMIQKMTFLRRTVGALLVALVALIGFSAQAAPPFVATSAMVIDWNEGAADNTTQLSDLNSLIDGAATSDADDFCYTLTSKPANFTFDSDVADDDTGEPDDKKAGTADDADNNCYQGSGNDIPTVYLSATAVSYEANKGKIVLTITGHSNGDDPTNTSEGNKVEITINVIDVDEPAAAVDKIKDVAGREAPIYMEENDSVSFLVSQLFSDPDGDAVQLKGATDIAVCSTGGPGSLSAPATPPSIAADAPYAINAARPCGLSSGGWNVDNTDPNSVIIYPAVVSVSRAGPQFTVTADELDDAGSGVYRVDLYVRVWSGDPSQTSDLATTYLLIKKGANNVPQVAGGATGFEVEVNEGTVGPTYSIFATPPGDGDWNAADLDEEGRGGGSGSHKDSLTYDIKGPSCEFIHKAFATYKLSGGVCAKAYQSTSSGNLTAVQVLFADAEGDSFPATVTVTATDGWDTVEYPLTIKLKNVNELIKHADSKKPEGNIPTSLRMTHDEERTLNLDDYFTDPEGDAISYSAYTDIDNKSASVEGSTLTIVGKGAPDEGDETSYKVTVIATDDPVKEAKTINSEITVNVRHDNAAPAFDAGIISVGMSAREDAEEGTYLSPLVNFTDADSETAELTASLDSDMFTAVVNPKVKNGQKCSTAGKDGCVQTEGKIAIQIAEALNFEEADSHTLSLGLEDDWGGKTASNLIIRVLVDDVNDVPTVVQTTVGEGDDAEEEDIEIPDQTIAVNGSGAMNVGQYFHDEDGDRLLIEASSDMKTVATVSTSGLDLVSYAGVAEGEAKITLVASDGRGGSVSHSFKVIVTENVAPVADVEAFAARLPADNTINKGSTVELALAGLFSDTDGGDEVVSTVASTSDESVLLVVSVSDGASVALVGREPGDATLTITATDKHGNMTSVEEDITVNAAPAEAQPLDPQTLNRVTPLAGLDLSGVFADADGSFDALTIVAEAIGDGADRVTLAVTDGMLTITGVAGAAPGETEIQLTATDAYGLTATSTFVATVENVNPTVAEAVETEPFDRIEPLAVDLNATFADADGEISAIVASVAEDSIVSVSAIDLEDGLLTVTALDVGEATVSLTATDDNGGTVTTDFAVTVNNVAPTVAEAIMDQTTTRVADPMLTVDAASTFSDPDTDEALELAVTSGDDAIAAVAIDGGMITVEGLNVGTATVTVTATDQDGGTISTDFAVAIENIAPTVAEQVAPIALDRLAPLAATLHKTFADADMDAVTITAAVADEAIATALVDGTDLTLTAHAVGTTNVTLTATDAHGGRVTTDFAVTVNNVLPRLAEAISDNATTRLQDLTLDVSGTFEDPDADALTLSATTGDAAIATVALANGTLTVQGTGVGDTTITLTATDAHGGTVSETFAIAIENIAPTVAMSVDDQRFDRRAPMLIDVSGTFADADDGVIGSITARADDDGVVAAQVDGTALTLTALAVGEARVTLTATDPNGGMISHDFLVTIENVNPTVANAVSDQTTTRLEDISLNVGGTFDDPDDANASLALTVATADGSVLAATLDGTTLTLQGLTVGTTEVTLTATDLDGGMIADTFAVTIENVNPTVANAVPDQRMDRLAPMPVDVSETFADADGTTLTLTATAADGSILEAQVDGDTLTLTALAVGVTNVTLTSTDADGGTASDTFAVTVVNIAPTVANAVADQTTTRVADITLDLSGTFDDADDANADLTLAVTTADGGVVEAKLDGVMLTLTGLVVGTTDVTVTATDAHGASVSNTFATTIENVDPVVANAVADITDLDRRAPATLDLSGTFMDADGTIDDLAVAVSDGMIIDAALEGATLTITALAVGDTTVTLTATDANGATAADAFEVTVVNIAPVVANAVADQTTTRPEPLTLDVDGTFEDPDQDDSRLTLAVVTADGTIVDASLNGATLMIQGLAVGATELTLTATDADFGMAETTFNVTIDNVAPQVAGSLSPVTLEVGGQPNSQAIAGLFSDDGDPLSYTVVSSNSGVASASLSGMTAMVAPVSRGSASYTITATDVHGESASLTASVTVGDGELKAVASKSLAGFGRALLASVSSSVGARVATDARAADLTLDAWAPTDDQDLHVSMTADDRSEQAWNVVNTTSNANVASANAGAMPTNGMDMLRSTFGQSFALNLGSSDNPSSWSIWGDVDRQSYEGDGYDGMASSVYIGADVTVAECWLFGVAVASNSGESDYAWGTATQTMDLSLTTVLPYISYQPTDRSSIWGVAGFGSGELDTTVQGASNDVSDLTSQILMVGGSQHLTNVGRFDLALKGDAASASLETDAGAGAADGLMADVSRIRAGLEGSFRTETGQGGMLEPFGQVSLRSDGGDGDTGTGIEVAGGVRMTSDTFALEVRGRTLAMHSADEYSESGFSLMATLNPSASATGVSVSIAPRWGADAQGGMGSSVIWQDTLSVNPMGSSYGAMTGFDNFGAQRSVDAQVGYGMLVAQEQYLLTPFVDFAVSDGARRELLFGASLRQMVRSSAELDVQLALGRVEERTGDSSGKIGLNATLRF